MMAKNDTFLFYFVDFSPIGNWKFHKINQIMSFFDRGKKNLIIVIEKRSRFISFRFLILFFECNQVYNLRLNFKIGLKVRKMSEQYYPWKTCQLMLSVRFNCKSQHINRSKTNEKKKILSLQ